jgi:hypothetical protein
MKKIVPTLLIFLVTGFYGRAQSVQDSVPGTVTIMKDPRLDVLAKKEADYNDLLASGTRSVKGYRLQVLSSNDSKYAMKVRSQLLQNYPEQKVYMSFQAPYIKLKFGNFVDKNEAEKYRQLLSSQKVVLTNIYLVPEMVEVKGTPPKEKDDN